MTTRENTHRRLSWLWKHRHTHDDDTLQEQITIIKTTIEEQGDVIGSAGSGAYVHLLRTASQSIGVGGGAIEWNQVVSTWLPLEFNITIPTTTIIIPKTGYYNVRVALEWDAFTDGGTVWVVRTRGGVSTQIWFPAAYTAGWTSTEGRQFVDEAPALPLVSGETLEVYVDHDAGSSQDLAKAMVAIYEVESVGVRGVPTAYRETILADGPVAYWRLGEAEGNTAAYDETGNGHNGTHMGGVIQGLPGLIAGDPDFAVQYSEASTDGTDVPIHADLKFLDADFTLEAWVQITDAFSGGTRFIVTWSGGPNWGLSATTGLGNVRFNVWRDGSSVEGTGLNYNLDTTYYVVATYDATTNEMIIYVDASNIDSSSSSTVALTDNSNPIRIGRDTSGGIDGIVDEVAVYDYVLTPEQIAAHYEAGI